MKMKIHTDGGARGNPGPAAIGVVIEADSQKIVEFGKRIGETTNNLAEYRAVVEALNYLKNHVSDFTKINEPLEIQFFIDSALVVNQLNGTFKIKEPNLREQLLKVRLLEQEIGGSTSYVYISREENRRADFLVNYALDSPLMSS